jgi:hypothetical protein
MHQLRGLGFLMFLPTSNNVFDFSTLLNGSTLFLTRGRSPVHEVNFQRATI